MLWATGPYANLLEALRGEWWLSTQPNIVNTGVTTGKALRLNSSIKCLAVDTEAYPVTCDMPNHSLRCEWNEEPGLVDSIIVNTYADGQWTDVEAFSLDVCVPVNALNFP